MLARNRKLDENAKKLLKNLYDRDIIFGNHGDKYDKIGIDGWYENIPFSLRNRRIQKRYGIDAVSWTYKWKSGKPGEWFYTKEELRIHCWTHPDNDDIVKVVFVNSDNIFNNRDYYEERGEIKRNTTNDQDCIMLNLDMLRKKNLIIDIL